MKEGVFFRIPESSEDIKIIRDSARVLEKNLCPAWLDENDMDYYLYVGSVKARGTTRTDADLIQREMDEMHSAGMLVDKSQDEWRIYITAKPEYDEWSIGIYSGNSPLELTEHNIALNPVLTRHDISDVDALFVADPFMIRQNGSWFMFFELMNWRENKGEIGLATSSDGLNWEYERRVLIEPFHLSYPYIFEHEGERYMLPESRQAGSVRLYRATEFPFEWSYVSTLLENGNLVDPSIFFSKNTCWMFCGDNSENRQDALRLFFSDKLTGPWQEHPESPVVQNSPATARPAGRVVVTREKILRFAQNCEHSYGTDVRAFEIRKLTRNSYEETRADTGIILKPTGKGWTASGMHHIDAHLLDDNTWLACVDGRA